MGYYRSDGAYVTDFGEVWKADDPRVLSDSPEDGAPQAVALAAKPSGSWTDSVTDAVAAKVMEPFNWIGGKLASFGLILMGIILIVIALAVTDAGKAAVKGAVTKGAL